MPDRSIFREKSIQRVSSPENLNDYIKVTTPSVWLLLAAVLILMIGVLIWAVCGRIQVNSANGTELIAPIRFLFH